MSQIGRIKLKDIRELTAEVPTEQQQQPADSTDLCPETDGAIIDVDSSSNHEQTPPAEPVKPKPRKRRAKTKAPEDTSPTPVDGEVTPTKSVLRRKARSTMKKEVDVNQKKIDCFFKSVSKNYKIEPEKLPLTAASVNHSKLSGRKCPNVTTGKKVNSTKAKGRGRKRLFEDTSSDTETEVSLPSSPKTKRKPAAKSKPNTRSRAIRKAKEKNAAKTLDSDELIDLCTDSEQDFDMKNSRPNVSKVVEKENSAASQNKIPTTAATIAPLVVSIPSKASTSSSAAQITPSTGSVEGIGVLKKRLRQTRTCPSYKVVAGTNFAVDGFNYGLIEGVTHYFLTHFHADHYIGLNRKFSMPLYASALTARLIRAFIPIDEQYLHELPLNSAVVIDDVEVTAIDANHCPGAVMLVFKLRSGKCILHTGDFRASPAMESEPIFWNNDIDTIYLDTTYLSRKFVFRSQDESIESATHILEAVKEKHKHKRLLVVCGSYLIGKEKFWTHLAREFQLKVWAEGNRRKALTAMDLYLDLLVEDPLEATMHVIPIGKIGYLNLVAYYQQFREHFDVVVAFRPSGWEKNSRPSYGSNINLIGIEYSEHSGYNELQRFVTFLKPKTVISTVPISGGDLTRTSPVPTKWYQYEKLSAMKRNFQPSITTYIKFNEPVGDTKESHPLAKRNSMHENFMLVSPGTVVNDSGLRRYPYRHVADETSCEAMDIASLNQFINDPDLANLGLDTEISEYQDLYQRAHNMDSRDADEPTNVSDMKPVADADALDDWMP